MEQKQVYRPTNIIPDKDSAVIAPSEGKAASNMRIGSPNPTEGAIPIDSLNLSIYKTKGNTRIPNPLLPTVGDNVTIGQCQDEATDRIVYANYNSNGDSAIYQYQNGAYSLIINVPDLSFPSEVDMNLRGDILIFTDNIKEPRTINIQKALDGLYVNFQPWMIAQLHRRPAFALTVNATEAGVVNATPKPATGLPLQGYQIGYNYEHPDFIESRISDPTRVLWSSSVIVTLPSSEINQYILANGIPNPYIVAVKFYYRIGNSGGWNLFKRVKNEPGWNRTVTLGILEELANIGGTTASALLLVDGIGRKVKTNYFADNRILHGHIVDGYSITLPNATTSIETQDDLLARAYRAFPPVETVNDLAMVYFDDRDRIIGSRVLTSQTTTPSNGIFWLADLFAISVADPGLLIQDPPTPWNQVVDYLFEEPYLPSPGPYVPSRIDLYEMDAIAVTPTGTIPAQIAKAVLAVKPKRRITNFIRTNIRPFWVYQDGDKNFLLSTDTGQGETFTSNSKLYNFYGLGFSFRSDEPIAFSEEQNYFVKVRGATWDNSGVTQYYLEKLPLLTFKITDQFGDVLISKQDPSVFTSNSSIPIGNFNSNDLSNYNSTVYGTYGHFIWDVCLYSKAIADVPWVLAPETSWTANELALGTKKYYYGPNYLTGDNKTLGQTNRAVFQNITGSSLDTNYWSRLVPVKWNGYWASMNLNGIFVEQWDSDTGNEIAIDSEPIEQTFPDTLRHGGAALSNTKINNLFAFNPIDEDTVSSQLGGITRIQSLALDSTSGENLHVVCRLGTVAIFLGRVLIQDNSGNSTLASSTRVFGSKNVYQQKFGATKLYDVVVTDKGVLFFYDNNKKALCQISNNGVDVISEQKGFRSDTFRFSDQAQSFIGYDPFFLEILVNQSAGEGLAYNFKQDIYQGQRFFGGTNPSEMFAYIGNRAYSFYKGELYLLNNNNQTEFNGVGYQAKYRFVSNTSISENKDFQWVTLKTHSGLKWQFSLISENGKESNLVAADFIDRKDYYEAAILRAVNSSGGKYNGDFMDGSLLTVEISDFDNDLKDIIFVEIAYSKSITNG